MSTARRIKSKIVPSLVAGQHLDQPTFHKRYEAMAPETEPVTPPNSATWKTVARGTADKPSRGADPGPTIAPAELRSNAISSAASRPAVLT